MRLDELVRLASAGSVLVLTEGPDPLTGGTINITAKKGADYSEYCVSTATLQDVNGRLRINAYCSLS